MKLLPSDAQEKRENQRIQDFKIFSDLCLAVGVDKINDVFSGAAARFNPNDIVADLSQVNDALVSTLAKRGIHLKTEIKRIGSKQGLTAIAESIHIRPDSKTRTMVTAYAGLNMSAEAIDRLQYCRENGLHVKAGRFIPCEEKIEIAEAAARDHMADKRPVLLTIKGYSLKKLAAYFNPNHSTLVFSSLATFAIEDIAPSADRKVTIVTLGEIASSKNAIDLLY